MLFPGVDHWDAATVQQAATADESLEIEKKASAKMDAQDWAELAKQVCAFSNSTGGFLVYGIDKSGRLDAGVSTKIGSTDTADVVIQRIVDALQPRIHGCRARLIPVPGHHAPDQAALVVQIPLSEARPHWVKSGREESYIRVDRHSLPMPRQTFLDIKHRTSSRAGEVVDLGPYQAPARPDNWPTPAHCTVINPRVRLTSGTVCRDWAAVIHVESGGRIGFGEMRTAGDPRSPLPDNCHSTGHGVLFVQGEFPLFPEETTTVLKQPMLIQTEIPAFEIVVRLLLDGAAPAALRFRAQPEGIVPLE